MKIKALFTIIVWVILSIGQVYGAAEVKDIRIDGPRDVSVVLESEQQISPDIEWADMKLLKNIGVVSVSPHPQNNQALILDLSTDLQANSMYSVLSVQGTEWNMNFTTRDTVENSEIWNEEYIQWSGIQRVFIRHARQIELWYDSSVKADGIEFKFLEEIGIERVQVQGEYLRLLLGKDIQVENTYLLIFLSVWDINGFPISFGQDLYEFNGGEGIAQKWGETQGAQEEQNITLHSAPTKDVESSQQIVLKENAAHAQKMNDDIRQMSLQAERMPDTGPVSYTILWIALLLNGFLLLRKRRRV